MSMKFSRYYLNFCLVLVILLTSNFIVNAQGQNENKGAMHESNASDKINSSISNFYLIMKKKESKVDIKDEQPIIEEEKEDTYKKDFDINITYPYKNKKEINLIGDSISQGDCVDSLPNDSYVGILRNLISLEMGKELNFGFVPFSTIDGFKQGKWNKDMIMLKNTTAEYKWADGRLFGHSSFGLSPDTIEPISFTINKIGFNNIKISYLAGNYGSFAFYKDGNIIAEFDCKSDKEEARYTEEIIIGKYDKNTVFTIKATKGNVYLSGVQLIENSKYVTFNNYSKSGLALQHLTIPTLEKEVDCDVLIWALGYNSHRNPKQFKKFIEMYTPIIKDSNCKVIVLDFIWDEENQCKDLLKKMAQDLDCPYVDVLSVVPKNPDGLILNGFLDDGVHPSTLGHRYIAEYLANELKLSVTSKDMANILYGMKI